MRLWLGLGCLSVGLSLAVGCTPYAERDEDDDGLLNGEEEAAGTQIDVADTDGDGLLDGEERDFGSDPLSADTDSDGVADNDEKSLGTDPVAADSDGDGYRDGDELAEDSDPTDADDKIYAGGWPYYADKDTIADPGTDTKAAVGAILARMKFPDQFGDEADIYDFAMQGRPVVIDVSGVWCYWCHQVAAFLDRKENYFETDNRYDKYAELPDMLEAGEFSWVTILDSNASGGDVTAADVEDWYADYPNPAIPVLLDVERESTNYFKPRGFPYIILVEEDMTISIIPAAYTKVWDELLARHEG